MWHVLVILHAAAKNKPIRRFVISIGVNTEIPENGIDDKKQRSTAARLINKVYGTDPIVCPRCGFEMKIVAIIMDKKETKKILEQPAKIGRPPPDYIPASLH
jgi:hypothetical protein